MPVYAVESLPKGKPSGTLTTQYIVAEQGQQKAVVKADARFSGRTVKKIRLCSPGWLHIDGRRWFRKSAGNTYCNANIFVEGKWVGAIGRTYGYGDHFLTEAGNYLVREKILPPFISERCLGTYTLREILGGTYSVADVAREKDL